jgi:hypothetical protein
MPFHQTDVAVTATVLNLIFEEGLHRYGDPFVVKELSGTLEFERKLQQLPHELTIPVRIKKQEFAEDRRTPDNRPLPGIT